MEITDTDSPDNLYELFQLRPGADAREIKKAYYNMQKVCHPDVAGEEGEEMCILLNDAYDTLSDKESRALYDEQLAQMQPEAIGSAAPIEVAKDLDPVWPWQPKKHGKPPVWKGTPLSRSRWDRVPPEGQGQKHQDQQFVYVDEFSCIACRNCCDVAPKSFCIDIEHGRARVYSQWGHDEEWLDYAVAACPVDCIHWVSREELQVLEHVTAEKLFEGGAGSLPCPMAVRQGMAVNTNDPWDMANGFNERMKRKEERWKKLNVTVDKFKARIAEVFLSLSLSMRQAIRGQGQKGA